MNIVINYDSSVANAPTAFKAAVQAAVNYYDNLITTPITVTIDFGYGEVAGQSMGSGALGESSGNGYFLNYSQVKSALTATATSTADILSVLNMPASDPTNGGLFWVTDAQAKAFGITNNPNFSDPEDGFVGLTSQYPLNYSPQNTSVAGQYSAVGVLEHEISEVLGRTSGLGSWTYGGQSVYTPLDLFRYTAPGVRDLTPAAGYFSVDGQTMLDQYNGASSGADLGDWGPTVYGDSYGYGFAGQAGVVTPVDQQVMDVLGYTLSTTATSQTPKISLTLAQFGADTATLAGFTSPFNLTVTGVSISQRTAIEAGAHVTAITISDTAADISAAIATLNSDSEITSIVVSDNAAITVTAAQQSADARALSELVNANGTAATVTVSGGGGGGSVVSPTFTGAAAVVSADLDSLNANTAVTSVVISDNAAVVLSVAQLTHDTRVLGELSDANGHAYALTVADTAADLAAAFGALNANSHVGALQISDNAALVLTAAQATQDTVALGKLANAGGGPVVVKVSDTAADILADLSALNAASRVGAIVVADNAALTLTAAQAVQASNVLGKLIDANSAATVIKVSDTAANLTANLASLGAETRLGAIVVSNNTALTLTAAQAVAGASALGKLTFASGAAPVVKISDTAAHLSAALDGLVGLAHLSTITISDSGRLSLSAVQVTGDASVLAKISGSWTMNVSDTAAHLTSALPFLLADASHLGAISVSDGGTLTLTAAQYSADSTVLAKIGGAHTVEVTGVTGQAYSSETFAYNSAGTLTVTTLHETNGSLAITGAGNGLTFSSTNAVESIRVTGTGDSFVINPGLGSETITGYNPASDVLSFSHTLFANAAGVLAAAANDGHGDVLIHVGASEIELVGVTLAQLSQHPSEFHFF